LFLDFIIYPTPRVKSSFINLFNLCLLKSRPGRPHRNVTEFSLFIDQPLLVWYSRLWAPQGAQVQTQRPCRMVVIVDIVSTVTRPWLGRDGARETLCLLLLSLLKPLLIAQPFILFFSPATKWGQYWLVLEKKKNNQQCNATMLSVHVVKIQLTYADKTLWSKMCHFIGVCHWLRVNSKAWIFFFLRWAEMNACMDSLYARSTLTPNTKYVFTRDVCFCFKYRNIH
jgi:hypothetical protein